jgi:hypothetical protein
MIDELGRGFPQFVVPRAVKNVTGIIEGERGGKNMEKVSHPIPPILDR